MFSYPSPHAVAHEVALAVGRPPARPRLAAAAVVGLAVAALARGQDPGGPTGSRAVADGPPLPPGAVARLGSTRFRTDRYFTDFAFSPDGKLVAGASAGRRLSVWEVATGREVAGVQAAEGPFGWLQFTADGKYVVVGLHKEGQRQELHGYEARTGRAVFRAGDDDFAVAWGPAWRPLDHQWKVGRNDTLWAQGAAGAGVRELRSFELPGGRLAGRIRVPDGSTLADWSPDGSHLLLVADGRLTLHATNSGPVWSLAAKDWADQPARLTPDGKRVVTHKGRRLRARDAASGRVVTDVDLGAGPGKDPPVPLSVPHDRYAVACRERPMGGRDFLVVDLERGRVCVSADGFDVDSWAVSPDGRFATTVSLRAGTSVWDLTRPPADPVARLPRAWAARFSPDGRTLALDGTGCLALFDVATWRLLPQSASPPSLPRQVRFTPDGRGLLALTADGWQVWDDWSKPDRRPLFGPADGRSPIHSHLSEDQRVTVEVTDRPGSGAKGPTAEVRVTDRRTGRTRTHPAAEWRHRDVVLSGDGRRVFTWTWVRDGAGEVRGWDTAAGDALPTWAVAEAPRAATLAVSRDGRWLALVPDATSPDAPDGIRLWDVERAREAGRIRGVSGTGPGHDQSAEFSPDGRRLAAVIYAPADQAWSAVRVWEWRTGRQLLSVNVADFMTVVALSADGRACAIGDDDGRLRVFEVASGGERASFRHGARVEWLALHPDGTKVAASSCEAPIYVWNLLATPARWDPSKADAVWADLASDARAAFAAMQALRADPAEAVAFLRARSPLPPAPSDERLADLLRRLDAPAFADRERAQKELAAVVEWVRPKLEAARKAATAEAGRRLDQVLKPGDNLTSDQLRQVRACEALEALGTPEAVRLLRTWAEGPAAARLTVEAKESLERTSR